MNVIKIGIYSSLVGDLALW